MIDISIQEAMRCLQLFQEYQPENGYVSQCFDLALSALKTIEDMTENGQEPPKPNVSRETLETIASYDCVSNEVMCENCKFYSNKTGCISNHCKSLLHRKEIEQWITTHYQNLPKHSDN